MRFDKGTSVGHYMIEGLLGAGAMGEVYRARDPRLERDVAIKVLSTGKAPEPDRLRRFEQEARAAAALTHPNILTIHDIGSHDGLPFLVSELLEGRTLRELLADGPLALERVIELGHQLTRGIGAAHAVRIVHRDLKPENLFITGDGTLKILDFGLAKLKPATIVGPDMSTIQASLPGLLVGTLAYMAPEQARGEPVDERADLFAVGALLYEMVTGASPFRRSNVADTMAAILMEPPAPLGQAGTPALERLLFRCLEKEPCDRPRSARDLACELDTVLAAPLLSAVGDHREENEPPSSIAVLPFTDMSPTRDQDYLCEGLAEELINSLTRIDGLRIAARSSSFQFRGSAGDIRAVGQQLGVATVVEGSVRKAGDRLRINVQLVDVADGYQRWSERYDRKLEDVFAIQDEIAESVATSLRGVLSRHEKQALQRPETDVETYEYFLRGRRLMYQFNRPAIESSVQMFAQAIERDPEYAPGWAGLAEAHAWLYEWYGGGEKNIEAADRASRRALELAPRSAEAHAARGSSLAMSGRYKEAAENFEKALAIDADYYLALYGFARMRFAEGETEQSAELFRRAGEAQREDFQSMILLTQALHMLGRDEEARQANVEGLRRVERTLELNPNDPRALSLGANALGDDGQSGRALRWSERALELYPDDQGVLLNGACLRAKMGMKKEALEILEYAFAQGWGKRDWVENDPDYDSLRDDPRFQALLDKLH